MYFYSEVEFTFQVLCTVDFPKLKAIRSWVESNKALYLLGKFAVATERRHATSIVLVPFSDLSKFWKIHCDQYLNSKLYYALGTVKFLDISFKSSNTENSWKGNQNLDQYYRGDFSSKAKLVGTLIDLFWITHFLL